MITVIFHCDAKGCDTAHSVVCEDVEVSTGDGDSSSGVLALGVGVPERWTVTDAPGVRCPKHKPKGRNR